MVQVGIVRIHIIGVLALHTLSSREMLAVVLSIQTLFGSIGIGLGGFIGYIVGLGTTSIYIDIGISGGCELLRLLFVGLMLYFHAIEHVALP